MAEGTYEYECMRAELLGTEKPDEEEFEKARVERLKREQEEQESAEAALLETQEESMTAVGGRLDELNTILSSTHQKLNRLKHSACGSLSNIFSRGSIDVPDASGGSPSTSNNASRRNTTASGEGAARDSDINDALENLNEIDNTDIQPVIPTEKIRAAKLDIQKKMTSHLDKLDSLLNKAENAEISMSEQNQQMRKMAK